MRVEDLTVEVRDRTLKRVGQVTPRYLDMKARTKWCAVGEWTLTLPGNHPMVPHLSEPGSGLLVTGPSGVVVHPPEYTDWTESRRNLVTNPTAREATTDWAGSAGGGGAASLTREVNSGIPEAPTFFRVTLTAAGTWFRLRIGSNRPAVTPGRTYTLSGWMRAKAGTTVDDGRIFLIWGATPTGSTIYESVSPNLVVTDEWSRVSFTAVAPEGAVSAGMDFGRNAGAVGDSFDVAGIMLEEADTAQDYLDGAGSGDNLRRRRWLGAADASESVEETRSLIRGAWRETVYDTLFSGPTRTPTRLRNQQNPDGTFTFSGVTDEIILQGARAFPDPSIADPQASSASRANDTRTGTTEAIMRQYVAFNVVGVGGSTAPAGRRRGLRKYLSLSGSNQNRGLVQTKSPRFQNLLELLQEMTAYDPAIGFRVVQRGSTLYFEVVPSGDRSAFVRFDVENGTIVSEEVQTGGPVLTDAIVAGQGEGTARTIVRRQTPESIAAEEQWGLVFEDFIDQRDTDDLQELQQSGDEALLEGQGGTAVKMVPADDTTMQVNVDWRQGDVVTTVVSGIETVARVTEVAYSVTSSGIMAGAALGDVSGFTQKDAESAKVQSIDSRVSNLERASAGPIGEDRLPDRISKRAGFLGTLDLDTVLDSGWYVQTANANATTARHYPTAQAGYLEVISLGEIGATTVGTLQRYTTYGSGGQKVYQRTKYTANTFGAWSETTAPDWGAVAGKPTTFPPSAHSHVGADVTDLAESIRNRLTKHVSENDSTGRAYFGTDAEALSNGGTYIGISPVASGQDDAQAQAFWFATSEGTRFAIYKDGGFKSYGGRMDTPHQAWAQASGEASVASTISNGTGVTVTITFPSGRFNRAPILTVTPGGSARLTCAILSVSATSATVRVDNLSGANASGVTALQWQATQMTSGSASG